MDKYFVQNLDKSCGRAIVGAASTLAKQLNLKAVAEGIETEGQRILCQELGIDIGQGLFIAKPLPKAELESGLVINVDAGEKPLALAAEKISAGLSGEAYGSPAF